MRDISAIITSNIPLHNIIFLRLSIILLIWRMGTFTLHYHSPNSLGLIYNNDFILFIIVYYNLFPNNFEQIKMKIYLIIIVITISIHHHK